MNKSLKTTIIASVAIGTTVGIVISALLLCIFVRNVKPAPVEPSEPLETVEPSIPETTGPVETAPVTEATEPPEVNPVLPPAPIVIKYVSASILNVRDKPSMEGAVVDLLERNTAVEVVKDLGDWTEIKYNGNQSGYAASQYLVTEEVKNNAVLDEISKRGNVGRLSIPSLGVNVAVFKPFTQDVVDNVDSAALLPADHQYRQDVIADHVNQGFDKTKAAVPGETRLIMDYGTYQEEYICFNKFPGHNTGKDLTDENYNSICGMNDGGLCLYVCDNGWMNVIITLWKKV